MCACALSGRPSMSEPSWQVLNACFMCPSLCSACNVIPPTPKITSSPTSYGSELSEFQRANVCQILGTTASQFWRQILTHPQLTSAPIEPRLARSLFFAGAKCPPLVCCCRLTPPAPSPPGARRSLMSTAAFGCLQEER